MITRNLIGITTIACVAVLGLAGCNAISTSQNTPPVNGTDALSAKVRASFADDTALRQDNIAVATDDGVVTLSGTVVSADDQRRAAALANMVPGVQFVENNLIVK
ncbi:MAG: BON domain-containing protein [Opitutaceae bacterium]